jgi:hypothetical protein
MKVTRRRVFQKREATFLILLASAVLLLFMLLPTTPIHSGKVSAAYSRYVNAPSEETKRDYEDTLYMVNRPFHILQYISGIVGLVLPLSLFRIWKRTDDPTINPER